MSRAENKRIAEDTVKLISSIEKDRKAVYISSEEFSRLKKEDIVFDNFNTFVEVEGLDVTESLFHRRGKGKIGVLNFASARHAGGGFLTGASAQEESLARVSDLYMYLKEQNNFYLNEKHFKNGLYDSDIIYSKDVSLLKNSSGHRYLDSVEFDVITSCAVNVSDIKNKNQKELMSFVDSAMLERIENITEISLRNGIEYLILGAFGCGVFGNSGYKVKGYFEKVLNSPRYKNKFKGIIFTVYERPQDNNKLLNIFKDVRI